MSWGGGGGEGGKSPLDDDGAVSGVEADFDRWPLSRDGGRRRRRDVRRVERLAVCSPPFLMTPSLQLAAPLP